MIFQRKKKVAWNREYLETDSINSYSRLLKSHSLWVKVDVSSTFIENIFRSGLTLVSSSDCFCHTD